jgi:hypothetical protein
MGKDRRMSARFTMTAEDAAFVIRAAEKWYAELFGACRGTSEEGTVRAYLDRVRRIKKRAKIGRSYLERIIDEAVPMTVNAPPWQELGSAGDKTDQPSTLAATPAPQQDA